MVVVINPQVNSFLNPGVAYDNEDNIKLSVPQGALSLEHLYHLQLRI